MKKLLFCPLIQLALAVPAVAADPSPPMADFEPQTIRPAGASQSSAPPTMVLDDFAFIAPTGQQTSAHPAGGLRNDDYQNLPAPHPAFEGF